MSSSCNLRQSAIGMIASALIIGTMPITKSPWSYILLALQAAARKQKTNPYQISKASGMSLTTIQRLLSIQANLPLLNVETLLDTLGVDVRLVPKGKPLARPGTQGRRGKRRLRRS
jgi:DNA-binding phage protein